MARDRSGERMAMTTRLAELLPRLNERDRRLALGAEAKSWGHGGIEEVHQATGMARAAISRGMRDLDAGENPETTSRVRASGGGREKTEAASPELAGGLEFPIEPGARGDPESALRWTTKETRN